MSTYGKFYNPEPPSNKWPNIILFICAIILFAWIFFCLTSCNSVKKSTDIQINKVDSSSTQKIDSSVQEKKAISFDSSSFKTWDKETIIEFEKPEISKPIDTGSIRFFDSPQGEWIKVYPITGYEDGQLKINGKIKKITIREKGKDSSSLKKVDNSQNEISLYKNVENSLEKFDKSKETNKESKRSSPIIWIVLGAVLIAGIFFFLIYKRFK